MASLPCLVWVDSSGSWANPHPGILLARRRVTDGLGRAHWEGWVIEAWEGGATVHDRKLYVHQSWHSFAHLRPVEAQPPLPDLRGHRPVNADRPR